MENIVVYREIHKKHVNELCLGRTKNAVSVGASGIYSYHCGVKG
jgi:hypothetical protein